MTTDIDHMTRALSLARLQSGRTGENPAVGCVILGADGKKLSEAATGDGGRPHAEELALSTLAPEDAKGGTAYVTLEPCRERSNASLSCSERLIAAGLARVVVSTTDPHPRGAGGADRLHANGIAVEIGLMQDTADRLYADFFASAQNT